jgi:uncharacterized membrane protein YdbT with pleckstrin-like domain
VALPGCSATAAPVVPVVPERMGAAEAKEATPDYSATAATAGMPERALRIMARRELGVTAVRSQVQMGRTASCLKPLAGNHRGS